MEVSIFAASVGVSVGSPLRVYPERAPAMLIVLMELTTCTSALHIGWLMMSPLPLQSGPGDEPKDARKECHRPNDKLPAANASHYLLACAFATWLPQLHGATASLGILYDCGTYASQYDVIPTQHGVSTVPSFLRPPNLSLNMSVSVRIVQGCLWGGVCLTKSLSVKAELQ